MVDDLNTWVNISAESICRRTAAAGLLQIPILTENFNKMYIYEHCGKLEICIHVIDKKW